MFAKAIVFFAAVSATQAGGLLGVGLGPIAATGHWEGPAVVTKSIVAAPVAVAQKSIINHISPVGIGASQIGIGGLVHGGNGILSNGLLSAPIAGKYLINAPATVQTQSTVINHVAPVTKTIAVAAAPIYTKGLLGNGLISGNGILNGGIISGSSIAGNGLLSGGSIVGNGFLGLGNGILGAPVVGKTGYAAPITAYSQSSVIDHVVPVTAPVQIAAAPVGIVSNGAWGATTGFIGGGLAGKAVISGPAAVSSQSSVINHVAPASVAIAPVATKGLVSTGLLSSDSGLINGGYISDSGIMNGGYISDSGLNGGYVSDSGLNGGYVSDSGLNGGYVSDSGLVNGGYIGAPVIGKAVVSAPNTLSTQSTVINHVAPASVAVATPVAVAAPVSYSSGIINNGLYGGSIGHGIDAAPLSISSGLLGSAWGGMYGVGAGKLEVGSGLTKSLW